MCLGIPGRIVEIVDLEEQRAIVEVEGVRREISVALLGIRSDDEVISIGETTSDDAVSKGDWVLVHVGFAMSRIEEAEAEETLRALRSLGPLYDEELRDLTSATEPDPDAGLR